MICERCGRQTNTYRYSWYNEQAICLPCSDHETKRHDYAQCRKVELEAVERGDLNFHYKTPQEMSNDS